MVAPPSGESDQPIPAVPVGGRFDLIEKESSRLVGQLETSDSHSRQRMPCVSVGDDSYDRLGRSGGVVEVRAVETAPVGAPR